MLEGRAAHQLLDVRAGAKGALARSSDDERPHVSLLDPLLDLGDPRSNLAEHRKAEGVQRLRSVQGEDGDAAAALELDRHVRSLRDEAGSDHRPAGPDPFAREADCPRSAEAGLP